MTEVADTPLPTRERAQEDPATLDRALTHGIAWTGSLRWAVQIASWASMLVVARLLQPADFGIVGMAGVYLGLVQMVNELGLSSAIVQHNDITREEVSGLGGLAVIVGCSFAIISILLSRVIASFFGVQAVTYVVMVLSTTFVISSFQVVPKALLARDLRFRTLALLDTAKAMVSMSTMVVLALLGASYWSLVFSGVLAQIFSAVVLNVLRPHGLRLPRPFAPLRHLVTFGGHVVGARIAWYTYSNADFAVVGRVLGKASLGAYSLAWNLASLPVEKVSVLVMRVTPAVFATVQDDQAALRRYLAALVEGIALITFPMSLGLMLTADDVVLGVLGAKWRAAILPLRLLAAYGGFRSINTLFSQILVATGHTRRNMDFTILAAVVLPIAFFVGSHWGTTGVAMGWILVYPVLVIPLFIRYSLNVIDMRPSQFLRALWPPLSASLVMLAVVATVRVGLHNIAIDLRLVTEVLLGAVTYAGVFYVFHRSRLRVYRQLLAQFRTH